MLEANWACMVLRRRQGTSSLQSLLLGGGGGSGGGGVGVGGGGGGGGGGGHVHPTHQIASVACSRTMKFCSL